MDVEAGSLWTAIGIEVTAGGRPGRGRSRGLFDFAKPCLEISGKYVLLSSDKFSQRIDALNHFLDGAYRAAIARLVFDERDEAMIKTISFSALPEALRAFIRELEGGLRRDIAVLEENAAFEATGERRYTLGLTLASRE